MSHIDRTVKQVIVIRRDLKMRRGKEIAQGAHASMAWLTARMTYAPVTHFEAELTAPERLWVENGFTKIVCQVNSEEELRAVVLKAEEARVLVHAITDAGLTEFDGVPTLTAIAVGPDWSERVNEVTGKLKLY